MKKILILACLSLSVFPLALPAVPAQAVLFDLPKVTPRSNNTPFYFRPLPPNADFTFTYQGQNFTVGPNAVNSWKGSGRLSRLSQVEQVAPEPKELLQKFLDRNWSVAVPKGLTFHFQPNKIFNHLKELSLEINSTSSEPTLVISEGRATEFTPPQTGRGLDLFKTTVNALLALEQGQTSADLVVSELVPKTYLSELNNLGINELIGSGESDFSGSPNNRRHNIAVGVEKMKGVIIQKGEEFSFNKYLGEVTKEAGFLPELVIKRTGTVPELGGGLCQVSSTAFRAAMNAGLPITERRNHAYAVQYYSPQGTDATIYPGVVDLRFANDTPGAILVWPYLKDKNTLVFDFYGTKDNRQVTLEKPVQWDRKTDGSMKASWTRIVVKDGQTATSTFTSNYRPPALYHKEETFVTPTTPTQTPSAPTNPTDPTTPPSTQAPITQ